ncbi:MAG: Lrp/AsnC ligand binding domain-containing protein [Candidatus Bathyarchaeia archaeon]|nr:Lrp/AsnC ligand binding domain-containing protein [Candidatus Bathyarchaeota archaeon]
MKEKSTVVYMLINTQAGKEREVVKEAKKFPGITEAKVVYGEYDVIIRIELNDFSILSETVTLIRKISGITKTVTLISA